MGTAPACSTPSRRRRPPLLQWVYDRRTRSKIVAAALVGIAVAVVVAALGLTALARTTQDARDVSGTALARVGAADDMRAALSGVRLAGRDAALAADPAAAQDALDRVPTLAEDFAAAVEAYADQPLTTGEQAALDAGAEAFGAYASLVAGTLGQLAVTGDDAAWLTADTADGQPLADAATAGVDDLRARAQTGGQAVADAAQERSTTTVVVLGLVVLVGAGVAVGWALALSNGIEGGMRDVRDVALALADGDLTRASSYGSRCELGEMSAALDGAVASLRTVMTEVVASADAVTASSQELSASSGQIAASSERTSAQAGVVSAAAGEVSRNVGTVAASSEQMGASIREISLSTTEAARVAADAVRAVADTSATALRLGESSQQIGDVVKVITSIAEQTNLLALNATIEAARAGAAGRGFAVVASEVKDLAQETAQATKGITRRVESIQGDTAGIVDAIGRIGAVIELIDSFQTTIASAVEEQTATTSEMVRSATEAAVASGEIALTIEGVSEAAAVTTESLSSTELVVQGLAHRALALRGAVGRFTF